MEQTGQGTATLDVPNTGSDTASKAHVQKTTPGDGLLTVVVNVDAEESGQEVGSADGRLTA